MQLFISPRENRVGHFIPLHLPVMKLACYCYAILLCRDKEWGYVVSSSDFFWVLHCANVDGTLSTVGAELLSTAWRWAQMLANRSRKFQWVL